MVWDANAPIYPAALRTMLATPCPSWTTAVGSGNESARCHYPTASFTGDPGLATPLAPDPLPLILIERADYRSKKWTEGVDGLNTGSMSLEIYVPAVVSASYPLASVYTAGQLEALAESLKKDLCKLVVGIPIMDVDVGEAQEPTDAALAMHTDANPAAVRSLRLIITFGLST